MYYYIEPMAEQDIEAVQEIERQSFSTSWSAKTYRDELRKPMSSRYIVARASATPPPPRAPRAPERRSLFTTILPGIFGPAPQEHSGNPLVGYAGLWLAVDEGHVTTIAVAPKQRGRAISELLLNGLIDQALELNATWLTLEVRVSNQAAQNLYLKYGFRAAGTRTRYYTDNGEDALIMWTEPIHTPEYQARLRELRQRLYDRLAAQANAPEAPLPPPSSLRSSFEAEG
jgi:[ribosomal protein S18]-alanine N-acetyltransferase